MSNRHPLVVKLKSGEYDGKDIMEAWLLIESLITEVKDSREHLRRVIRAYFSDSGAEPSVSVLGRAVVEAREYLDSGRGNPDG